MSSKALQTSLFSSNILPPQLTTNTPRAPGSPTAAPFMVLKEVSIGRGTKPRYTPVVTATLAAHQHSLALRIYIQERRRGCICSTSLKQTEWNVNHQRWTPSFLWSSAVACWVLLKMWQMWHSAKSAGFGWLLQGASYTGGVLLRLLRVRYWSIAETGCRCLHTHLRKAKIQPRFSFFFLKGRKAPGSATGQGTLC